jgi:ABC-2 type transport system permease protein
MIVDLDSLRGAGEAIAIDKQLNLDDMLFKYGVRVNHNLIMDLQSSAIPMVTGYIGNQPRQAMMPWYFFPVLTPVSDHPVVKNLNAVRCEFVSSIDTVRAEGVKKSILLSTSRYSRLAFAPVRVSLNVARSEPDERQYSRPPQPVAVLLEGVFPSLYARHVPEEISGSKEIDFREMSVPGKMLVVSDGAFIRNHYNPKTGAALPLGFDRFIRQSFGNKDFMLNAVDYMLNESGLIAARTRDVKLRMLDRKLAEEEKTQWQIVNTAGPVILVLLAGWLVHVLRIRKYAR